MRWWRRVVRGLWPLGRGRQPSPEARQASLRADESVSRAEQDRLVAARRRVEADRLAERLRAHNVANKYDDWLRQVVGGS
ncbi:DUF7620 family protein [Micromonospora haikouensis]